MSYYGLLENRRSESCTLRNGVREIFPFYTFFIRFGQTLEEVAT
jgi:hypothetical protein